MGVFLIYINPYVSCDMVCQAIFTLDNDIKIETANMELSFYTSRSIPLLLSHPHSIEYGLFLMEFDD